MSKNRVVHYRGKKERYKAFLDYCERAMREKGAMHRDDLISNAVNKRGQRLQSNIPIRRAFGQVIMRDKHRRFVRISANVYALDELIQDEKVKA
jgi:hypothetical protein